MTIEARRSRSRHLCRASGSHGDVQAETVSREHSSGNIVQMDQSAAVILRKSPHHAPRGLLRIHMHVRRAPRFLEAKGKMRGQLMNSRVSSDP